MNAKFRAVMLFRVVVNALYMAPPLIGVLVATSTVWNVVWWAVFCLWTFFLISRDPRVGYSAIQLALAAVVILLEVNPKSEVWSYVVGIFVVMSVSVAYRDFKQEALASAMQVFAGSEAGKEEVQPADPEQRR